MSASAVLERPPVRLARVAPLVVGVVGALASLAMPLGYDEAFWLAIVGKVEAGATLYDGAIETKTPIVYLAIWLIDVLPGSFVLLRALVMGGIAAMVALAGMRLTRRMAPSVSIATATMLAGTALLQAELHFTTEAAAVTLLLVVLAWADRLPTGLLATGCLAALAFDPRTVLLMPALVMMVVRRTDKTKAKALAWFTGVGVAAGVIAALLHPDLRYALIELNLASRGIRPGWFLSEQMATMARTLLPPLVWLALGMRWPGGAPWEVWLLVLAGAVVGLASIHPFDHYWSYVLLAVPFLVEGSGWRTRSGVRVGDVALASIAAIPLLANVVASGIEQREILARYQAAADLLEQNLAPEDTFVVFDIKPYLTALLPEHNALRAPTVHYLTMPVRRSEAHRAELPTLLEAAEAIADDGGLSVDPELLSPAHRPLSGIFRNALDGFPCVVRLEGITLWFRPEVCPGSS